jgi:hypothetical protein
VARELVDLVAVTRGARRYHGAGALETLRRARALRRRGFTYPEAYGYGLFDPALPEDRRSGFVSKHENTAVQRLLNGEDSPPLVSDKVAFGLYCRAAGIPAPDLLAIVHAQGDGWAADGPVLRDESDWRAAVDAFPAGFVVKPADGYGGRGVRVLSRDGHRLVTPEGRGLDAGELWRELRADRDHATFIVQERLRNHPEIAALGGTDETLHTLRLVTLVRRDGGAELLWAGIKLGVSGSGVDNIQKGTTGNLSRVVEADGTVGATIDRRTEAPGWNWDEPSGPPVRIPRWDDAVALVCDAALAFPGMRTLGWDVAVAPDGPRVIEANAHWGVEESGRMAAVFARMRTA